jgi:hypothetical protein
MKTQAIGIAIGLVLGFGVAASAGTFARDLREVNGAIGYLFGVIDTLNIVAARGVTMTPALERFADCLNTRAGRNLLGAWLHNLVDTHQNDKIAFVIVMLENCR